MKRVLLIIVGASLVLSSLFATCSLEQKGSVKVDFKGYKTPLKIGVGGTFDTVTYQGVVKKAHDLKALLVGASVTIDPASVNSANASRDEKLAKFFFGRMKTDTIQAKIFDVVTTRYDKKRKPLSGIIKIRISMNGITRDAALRYDLKKETLHAKGYIDLSDFDAQYALKSLNKVCYDLHEGKTWSDVAISFTMKILTKCD